MQENRSEYISDLQRCYLNLRCAEGAFSPSVDLNKSVVNTALLFGSSFHHRLAFL